MDMPVTHPLKPVVDGWFGKIERAIQVRQPWQDVADECSLFFCGPPSFLWDPQMRTKLWGVNSGAVNPTFAVQLNKAFELLAIFGPSLYWRNPQRTAKARPLMELFPQLFGDVQNDPAAAQMWQQAQAFSQQEMLDRGVRAQVMREILNYLPRVNQLYLESELAITDALLTGRGVLFTEPYQMPGSQKRLVGSFRCQPKDFLVDGDAERADEAWWIARRSIRPRWKLERDWKLSPDALKSARYAESTFSQGERRTDYLAQATRDRGEADDLVEVWEVWSKAGVGVRLTGMETPLKERLDQTCGDYCYLAMVRGIPYPLNMPTERLMSASVDEVSKAFRWPMPTWTEGKWPCNLLDFYPHPSVPYPVPPLAPGLGELKAMNIIFAHLVGRVWKSSRDFIVVVESARKAVEGVIANGKDLDFIVLPEVFKSIDEVVQFLKQPDASLDVWKVLDALSMSFDKRVGLTEMAYGLNPQGKQLRSATDAQLRQQNMNIRPEHMAAKVEQWQADLGKQEAYAIKWFTDGSDYDDLLGPIGAQVFDRWIAAAAHERIIRDIDYTVEANSARRPNKDRDQQNLNDFMQVAMPFLQMYVQSTGDFQTVQALFQQWGKLADFDLSWLQLQPPQPPPDAQQQQQMMMEQMQQQMQMQQQQFQAQEQLKQAGFQAEQQRKQEAHQQEMSQDQQESALEMALKQNEFSLQAQIERRAAQAKLEALRAQTAAKVRAARQMAAARPKPQARPQSSRT